MPDFPSYVEKMQQFPVNHRNGERVELFNKYELVSYQILGTIVEAIQTSRDN